MSADEFSALFRRDADNERLYRESEARLDLAERMTAMRHAAGLSQQQLADRVGRKQPFIARLEKGAYDRCGLSTLRTFARAMGFDINSSTMFVQEAVAHFSGKSSCSGLERSFETFEEQSGKIASISLASWDRADLSTQSTSSAPKPREETYSAA
jgi:transcriptional regulator with XRE-family HTH domain